jgi:hypothetical protein
MCGQEPFGTLIIIICFMLIPSILFFY